MPETIHDAEPQATEPQATEPRATYGFVRAVLDRWVELPGLEAAGLGSRWRIPWPRVRDALPVLASAPGLVRGEAEDAAVFWETLGAWLPADLVEVLRLLKPVDALRTAYGLIAEGAPAMPGKAGGEDETKTRRLDEVDWDGLLSDYCHTYKVGAAAVMDEPWNAFLLLSLKARRVHAREQWRDYVVQAMVNAGERETRQRLFRHLMGDAEFEAPDERTTRRERLAQQEANLASLDGFFGALKSNPSA